MNIDLSRARELLSMTAYKEPLQWLEHAEISWEERNGPCVVVVHLDIDHPKVTHDLRVLAVPHEEWPEWLEQATYDWAPFDVDETDLEGSVGRDEEEIAAAAFILSRCTNASRREVIRPTLEWACKQTQLIERTDLLANVGTWRADSRALQGCPTRLVGLQSGRPYTVPTGQDING